MDEIEGDNVEFPIKKFQSQHSKNVTDTKGMRLDDILQLKNCFEMLDPNGDRGREYNNRVDDLDAIEAQLRILGYNVSGGVLVEADRVGNEVANVKEITKEEAIKGFRLFDIDGTGIITIDNLRVIAEEIGEYQNEEQLQEMIEIADSGDNCGSGVTIEDFVRIMTL